MADKRRIIRLIGSIDEAAYKDFSEKLYEFEQDSTKDPVTLELSSEGGVAYDALAFAGRMRLSPCDIIVVAHGYVASAAVIILAYGDIRKMTSESWAMMHEDSAKRKERVTMLEVEVGHLRRLENQWSALLEAKTGTHHSSWSRMHKATTYLSAAECKELGLIDEVI